MVSSQRCIGCDLQVPDDSRFCPHCGFNLRVLTEDLVAPNKDDNLLKISGVLLILIGISTIVSSALLIYFYIDLAGSDDISDVTAHQLMLLSVNMLVGGIIVTGGIRAMTGNNFVFVIICSVLALSNSYYVLLLASYFSSSTYVSFSGAISLAAVIFIVSIRDRFVS